MSKKLLFIYLCIGAVVLVGGFLWWRGAVFSKEILKLEIVGPETAAMGQEITYTVKYKNNGNFILENLELLFELPEHSLSEE